MVTQEKENNTALIKYRMGNVFIWLGILTWLPFILLQIFGEKPPIFWYLPFHLVGVIGGSRLRAAAHREMNITPVKKNALQMLGHGLIVAGILVWAPYFYLKAVVPSTVDMMAILPYHLAGVLGGIVLLAIRYLLVRKSQNEE